MKKLITLLFVLAASVMFWIPERVDAAGVNLFNPSASDYRTAELNTVAWVNTDIPLIIGRTYKLSIHLAQSPSFEQIPEGINMQFGGYLGSTNIFEEDGTFSMFWNDGDFVFTVTGNTTLTLHFSFFTFTDAAAFMPTFKDIFNSSTIKVVDVQSNVIDLFDLSKVQNQYQSSDTVGIRYTDATLADGWYRLVMDGNVPVAPSNATSTYLTTMLSPTSWESLISMGTEGIRNVHYNATYQRFVAEVYVRGGTFTIYLRQANNSPVWGTFPGLTNANTSLEYLDAFDDVEPEFTYSNLRIDAPWDNLPSVAQIMSQLQAIDDQDGDVSSRIEVYHDAYTALPKQVFGSYFVMFRVSDLTGNYAYLRIDINVIDNSAPTATYMGQPFDPEAPIQVQWYNDDQYGAGKMNISDIVDLFEFFDDYWPVESLGFEYWTNYMGESPFEDIPGYHAIYIRVTDPAGNQAEFMVLAQVIENNPPVITGPDSINFEAIPGSFLDSSILAFFSAIDNEDGPVAVSIDVGLSSPGYLSGDIGDYLLYIVAVDSLGRETLKDVMLYVRDTTAPSIKINNITTSTYTINVPMSNTAVLQALINQITAHDSYQGTIANIVVPAFPSFSAPGTTVMTIRATDASGNQGTLQLTVVVQDDIQPVINGATKVVKGKTAVLTLSEILAQLSAVDNVSGTLPVVLVTDGYTGNAQKVGSYLVQVKATDAAGNIKYHDIRVWVVDNVAPVWVVNDYFINLGLNEPMTRTQLIALLQASGMLPSNLSYTVTFLTDEYTGNQETPGTYSVVMRVTFDNGNESNLSVVLNVPQPNDDDPIVVTPDTPVSGFIGFITGAWNWIKGAWNWVKGAAVTVWEAGVWVYENILAPVFNWIFVPDTPVTPDPIVTTTTTSVTTSITTSLLPNTTNSNPIQNM
jgi:hypothetical protein